MTFDNLTHDELADAAAAFVGELHRRQAALPESAFKAGMGKRVEHVHRALDFLKEHAVNGGLVQPQSGGIPK